MASDAVFGEPWVVESNQIAPAAALIEQVRAVAGHGRRWGALRRRSGARRARSLPILQSTLGQRRRQQ